MSLSDLIGVHSHGCFVEGGVVGGWSFLCVGFPTDTKASLFSRIGGTSLPRPAYSSIRLRLLDRANDCVDTRRDEAVDGNEGEDGQGADQECLPVA